MTEQSTRCAVLLIGLGLVLVAAGCNREPSSCEELGCAHGACSLEITIPLCTCEDGYSGRRCEACSAGFHGLAEGGCAADEVCNELSCSEHALCNDESGKPVCSCADGYAGERCEGCAPGHYRHLASGLCMPYQCEKNAIKSEVTIDFDSWADFPSAPDVCGASMQLGNDDISMVSILGDGYVWSCAPSTIYDLSSPHIVLDAGNLGPAQLSLSGEVERLSFDYAAYSALAVSFFADGVAVDELRAPYGTSGRVELEFPAPISLFEIRSLLFTSQMAVDNLSYAPPPCP